MVKNLPAVWETLVWFLGQEDPLEEGVATHSSVLAWKVPWTEGPGGLQCLGSQRVGQSWASDTHTKQGAAGKDASILFPFPLSDLLPAPPWQTHRKQSAAEPGGCSPVESRPQGNKTGQRRAWEGAGASWQWQWCNQKNKPLIFSPSSWHRAPKTLRVPLIIRTPCIYSWQGKLDSSGWGWSPERPRLRQD